MDDISDNCSSLKVMTRPMRKLRSPPSSSPASAAAAPSIPNRRRPRRCNNDFALTTTRLLRSPAPNLLLLLLLTTTAVMIGYNDLYGVDAVSSGLYHAAHQHGRRISSGSSSIILQQQQLQTRIITPSVTRQRPPHDLDLHSLLLWRRIVAFRGGAAQAGAGGNISNKRRKHKKKKKTKKRIKGKRKQGQGTLPHRQNNDDESSTVHRRKKRKTTKKTRRRRPQKGSSSSSSEDVVIVSSAHKKKRRRRRSHASAAAIDATSSVAAETSSTTASSSLPTTTQQRPRRRTISSSTVNDSQDTDRHRRKKKKKKKRSKKKTDGVAIERRRRRHSGIPFVNPETISGPRPAAARVTTEETTSSSADADAAAGELDNPWSPRGDASLAMATKQRPRATARHHSDDGNKNGIAARTSRHTSDTSLAIGSRTKRRPKYNEQRSTDDAPKPKKKKKKRRKVVRKKLKGLATHRHHHSSDDRTTLNEDGLEPTTISSTISLPKKKRRRRKRIIKGKRKRPITDDDMVEKRTEALPSATTNAMSTGAAIHDDGDGPPPVADTVRISSSSSSTLAKHGKKRKRKHLVRKKKRKKTVQGKPTTVATDNSTRFETMTIPSITKALIAPTEDPQLQKRPEDVAKDEEKAVAEKPVADKSSAVAPADQSSDESESTEKGETESTEESNADSVQSIVSPGQVESTPNVEETDSAVEEDVDEDAIRPRLAEEEADAADGILDSRNGDVGEALRQESSPTPVVEVEEDELVVKTEIGATLFKVQLEKHEAGKESVDPGSVDIADKAGEADDLDVGETSAEVEDDELVVKSEVGTTLFKVQLQKKAGEETVDTESVDVEDKDKSDDLLVGDSSVEGSEPSDIGKQPVIETIVVQDGASLDGGKPEIVVESEGGENLSLENSTSEVTDSKDDPLEGVGELQQLSDTTILIPIPEDGDSEEGQEGIVVDTSEELPEEEVLLHATAQKLATPNDEEKTSETDVIVSETGDFDDSSSTTVTSETLSNIMITENATSIVRENEDDEQGSTPANELEHDDEQGTNTTTTADEEDDAKEEDDDSDDDSASSGSNESESDDEPDGSSATIAADEDDEDDDDDEANLAQSSAIEPDNGPDAKSDTAADEDDEDDGPTLTQSSEPERDGKNSTNSVAEQDGDDSDEPSLVQSIGPNSDSTNSAPAEDKENDEKDDSETTQSSSSEPDFDDEPDANSATTAGDDVSVEGGLLSKGLPSMDVPSRGGSVAVKRRRRKRRKIVDKTDAATDLATATDDKNDLTVSVVTWNLAEESPEEEDAAFIRSLSKRLWGVRKEKGSDIVLISGQECENIKPRRTEGRRSREFRRLMIKMLGKDYVPIAMHLLGGIQLGLFCKRSILDQIEYAQVSDVTCGIGNVFHNKGAIGAFLQLKAREPTSEPDAADNISAKKQKRAKSLRLLFVTAHMAAHVKNAEARDADFWRICGELEAQAPPRLLLPASGRAVSAAAVRGDDDESGGARLLESMDRIFFCGDLNYRVDLPREQAECGVLKLRELITDTKNDDMDSLQKVASIRKTLLLHDQLLATIAEQRAFPGFAEGKITFLPTFKFDKGTSDYDTSHKQRIPAWTDRILFKPNGTRVLEYDSVPDAQHSDHRPVFATFRMNMEGRPIPETPTKKSRRGRSPRKRSSRTRGKPTKKRTSQKESRD